MDDVKQTYHIPVLLDESINGPVLTRMKMQKVTSSMTVDLHS